MFTCFIWVFIFLELLYLITPLHVSDSWVWLVLRSTITCWEPLKPSSLRGSTDHWQQDVSFYFHSLSDLSLISTIYSLSVSPGESKPLWNQRPSDTVQHMPLTCSGPVRFWSDPHAEPVWRSKGSELRWKGTTKTFSGRTHFLFVLGKLVSTHFSPAENQHSPVLRVLSKTAVTAVSKSLLNISWCFLIFKPNS